MGACRFVGVLRAWTPVFVDREGFGAWRIGLRLGDLVRCSIVCSVGDGVGVAQSMEGRFCFRRLDSLVDDLRLLGSGFVRSSLVGDSFVETHTLFLLHIRCGRAGVGGWRTLVRLW